MDVAKDVQDTKKTQHLRLSSKITGLIFWGAVLTGLLVVAVFIKQSEDDQRLKQEYQAMMVMHALEGVLAPRQSVGDPSEKSSEMAAVFDNLTNSENIVGAKIMIGEKTATIGAIPEGAYAKTVKSAHVIGSNWQDEMSVSVYFDPESSNIYAGRKNLIVFLGVVSFAFGLIINRVLKRMLTNPIDRMTQTAADYASGDKSVRFEAGRDDEFGFMAQFINKALDSSEAMHRQLEESFHEQREAKERAESTLAELEKAKDRLVQSEKLASLGQLTAGIAHEIKNPLNFINNFSETSLELLAELNELIAGHLDKMDEKVGEEVGELVADLSSDLQTIAKHGKRADSIVKNMLMHSREGGGERTPTDLNALVSEAIGLAYHGERAVDSDFQVDINTDLGDGVHRVMVIPQDITRVLINLLSNAFYATKKRKEQDEHGGYVPAVSVTTIDKDDGAEIRIHDNGTGITEEDRKSLFSPFFTTKPTGQGTGLGLSISHDIITKQHDGMIGVNSKPGEHTEFIIWLPSFTADGVRFGAPNEEEGVA